MSDDVEWGPWVEHDGKGCPCVGVYVHTVRRNGQEQFIIAGARCAALGVDPNGPDSAWVWGGAKPGYDDIIRYRIRKPRALRDLITLAADPYAPPPVIHPEGPVRQPERVPG